MPLSSLADRLEVELGDLIPHLKPIITNKTASLTFGDLHPNPFIRALPDEPVTTQLAKLVPQKLDSTCIYPLKKHLKSVVSEASFSSRPFSLKLALGAPQYTFDFFDPYVLEHYLQQQKCQISNDVQGSLAFAQTRFKFTRASFGPSYGHQFTDLIASNLGDLSQLPAHDQVHWDSMLLSGSGTIHPDVSGPLLKGSFRKKMSVFEALLAEMKAVNALCPELSKPPLFIFHADPSAQSKNFGFIPVPSAQNFGQFFLHYQILLLQNINPAFLKSIRQPAYESITPRISRALNRPSKTSLEMVSEWLVKSFDIKDEGLIVRLSNIIKSTRKEFNERQMNGYSMSADQSYMHIQRRLMWYAYQAVKWIRQTFEQYFNKKYEALHPLLREEKVWVI
ncbi:MAG: hypothetical protein AB8G77_02475 [Rhodothermales bacterium]